MCGVAKHSAGGVGCLVAATFRVNASRGVVSRRSFLLPPSTSPPPLPPSSLRHLGQRRPGGPESAREARQSPDKGTQRAQNAATRGPREGQRNPENTHRGLQKHREDPEIFFFQKTVVYTHKYPSTGNLCCQFFCLGWLISFCSYSFWRRKDFLMLLNGCSFSPGWNYDFSDLHFFPLCEIRPKAVYAQIT